MCEEVSVIVYFAPLLMELKASGKEDPTVRLLKLGLIHESVTSLKATFEDQLGRQESPDSAYHPHFPRHTPNSTFFMLSICASARCQASHSSVADSGPGRLTLTTAARRPVK